MTICPSNRWLLFNPDDWRFFTVASSSVHAQSLHWAHDNKRLRGTGLDTVLTQLNAPFRRSKRPRDSHGRRNAIMTVALTDAMYYGAILLFYLIGILGMCMEMVWRK
jgi:hypothetical protein